MAKERFQTVNDMLYKTRKREFVLSRQISMVICKENKLGSLEIIGQKHGNRDHATVLHAIKTINNLCETDKAFNVDFKKIYYSVFFKVSDSRYSAMRHRETKARLKYNPKQQKTVKRTFAFTTF